jgi:hypothetical protein
MSEREAAREMLRELLHEALAGGNGDGTDTGTGVVPQVPPPPVAAVHRPAKWEATTPAPQAGTELVVLRSDADLDRFVRTLLARFESPEDREAIRSGRLRFTLREGERSGVVRVVRGAVTERTVEKAAKAGGRLVLGPGAVLTPLAREKARAKGIEIERER